MALSVLYSSYRAAVKQVVVAVRRPLGGLQLGLRGHGPAYTMGQGLRRRDRRGQRQRDEGSRPERGETAWAREHSETKEDLLNGESELNERRRRGSMSSRDLFTHRSIMAKAR